MDKEKIEMLPCNGRLLSVRSESCFITLLTEDCHSKLDPERLDFHQPVHQCLQGGIIDHFETVTGATLAKPPSIPSIWPVMKSFSGCKRKLMALATSPGCPILPNACIFSEVCRAASLLVNLAVPGVAICRGSSSVKEISVCSDKEQSLVQRFGEQCVVEVHGQRGWLKINR